MSLKSFSRRGFLLGTAGFGGVLGLVGASGSASAFEIQQVPPQSRLGLEIKNHCSVSAGHDEIRAKLEQDLLKRSGAPGALLTETAYCPLCGCPIIATRYVQ
jgi:hypothetical protein